jgi:hypothetical protein
MTKHPSSFHVSARFVHPDGRPFTGEHYLVEIWDQDPFTDDFLGSSPLDANGVASFLCFFKDMQSLETPFETEPDIYFVIKQRKEEIFRTKVFPDVRLLGQEELIDKKGNISIHFGPFVVMF